jgi:hypothetical protein
MGLAVSGARPAAPVPTSAAAVLPDLDGLVRGRLTADTDHAGDAWLTSPESLGATEPELSSMKAMYALLNDVLSSLTASGLTLPATHIEYDQELPAFPVAMTQVVSGSLVSETALVSSLPGDIAPTVFQVPTGYREEKLLPE